MAKKKTKKTVAPKKSAKTESKKTSKKPVAKKITSEIANIEWQIPVAFISGVLITLLICWLGEVNFANTLASNLGETDSAVELVILTDASCPICDDSWIEPRVEIDFSNVEVEYVDVSSAEGQAYMDTIGITSIPAAFFKTGFEEAENYTTYSENGWIVPVGDYYVLSIQGEKDLTKTESANAKVDLFVMSQCPYGTPAQQAMIELKEQVPDFELNINYIGNVFTETEWTAMGESNYYESYGMCEQKNDSKYYCSLHGPEEVEDDIAQLCAMEYYDNWTSFITAHIANSFDINSTISEMGYNETLMNNCINSEIGWGLFETSTGISDSLGVGSSPTYVFDNVYTGLGGSTPSVVLCTLHSELDGCDTVSVSVGQATGSC